MLANLRWLNGRSVSIGGGTSHWNGKRKSISRQLMTGDANAFDRFVTHFRAEIFHYSRLMCGHREDAEDVAQDTLLKVFESFNQLRDPARVRPWVFRIARNACLIKRRKSIFEPSQELSLDDFMPAIDHECGHANSRSRIGQDCPIVSFCNQK